MNPKQKSKAQPAHPQSDQVAAVRRLAQDGQGTKAKSKLNTLRKAFPAFKPLLALAWEIEDLCGSPILATARALEWQQASPQSRAAAEALRDSSLQAGFSMLYRRALERLADMDGRVLTGLPTVIGSPLGDLTLAQAEALDLSRLHLADDNPRAAAAVLQGVDHPSAQNNLALAMFVDGQVANASAAAMANWQDAPDNLFALESAVRWRCWLEGIERCQGFTAPLAHTLPLRSQDAISQVLALRFLGDEAASGEAWKRMAHADFWANSDTDQRVMFDSLEPSTAVWPGGPGMWFPGGWNKKLTQIARQSQVGKEGDDAHWNDEWAAVLDTCDAHTDYLTRAAQRGDDTTRMLAVSVLKRRAKLAASSGADQGALVALTSLLTQPHGPDTFRMDVQNWLIEQGLRSRDEPADVWLNGGVRQIRSYGLEINDEPQGSPFPPEGAALNELVHAALGRGDLLLALKLATQLQGMFPHEPSALTNLAAIKEGLGHNNADILSLYRQAHALNPDYLFARCGLARYLAQDGKLQDGQALVAGLWERKRFHRSEYRSFLLTQQVFALAAGDTQTAQGIAKSIADLQAN